MNEHCRGPEFGMSVQAVVIRESYLEEGGYKLEFELEIFAKPEKRRGEFGFWIK